MKGSSAYTVQFVGLSNGTHYFNFDADQKFFDLIQSELIQNGDVAVNLELEKNNHTLTLQFEFEGKVATSCDRCMIDFAYPLHGNARLIVKTSGEKFDEQDDIITLPFGSFEIDLSQFIFDSIALTLPLKIVPCEIIKDDTMCDHEIINRINNKSAGDKPVDPRWAALNKLRK